MPEKSKTGKEMRVIKIKKSTYDDLVSFSSSMTDTFADVMERVVDYYKKGHPKR